MKGLDHLQAHQDEYDKESQELIKSLAFAKNELSEIDSMKRTEGWKILDKKIREELQSRIIKLIENDLQVQTLLALLKVADVKTQSQIIENEIKNILPE